MSVKELIFKTDGEDLVFTHDDGKFKMIDKNLIGKENYYEFDRSEAHLLKLWLEEHLK